MMFKTISLIILQIIFIKLVFAEGKTRVVKPIHNNFNNWNFRGNLFDNKWKIGKTDIDAQNPYQLIVSTDSKTNSELINPAKGGTDIFTKQHFGDCTIELEVMVPKDSNSGIYVMGLYEVQIKDSFNKKQDVGKTDMGAICGFKKPLLNAAKKYGEWQKITIEFKAPQFKNGKRTEPAEFTKIILNGHIIHKNVKMLNGPSSGSLKKNESKKGPLMFQGGLGAVAYRNIKIRY